MVLLVWNGIFGQNPWIEETSLFIILQLHKFLLCVCSSLSFLVKRNKTHEPLFMVNVFSQPYSEGTSTGRLSYIQRGCNIIQRNLLQWQCLYSWNFLYMVWCPQSKDLCLLCDDDDNCCVFINIIIKSWDLAVYYFKDNWFISFAWNFESVFSKIVKWHFFREKWWCIFTYIQKRGLWRSLKWNQCWIKRQNCQQL